MTQARIYRRLLPVATAGAALVLLFQARASGALPPVQPTKVATFPTVTADALDKNRITVPADLAGQINLLLLSFAADQQNQLETWTATEQALLHTETGFRTYRIPIAERENAIFRWWANASLRSAETDPESWHWVVPLYVEKSRFLAQLGIPNENSIVVLLVDKSGRVLWRTTGSATAESRAALTAAVSATH